MNRRIILIMIALIFLMNIFANENDNSSRDLFYKQARRMTSLRQYENALSLYEKIMKNYTPNSQITRDFLSLVIRLNEKNFPVEYEKYKIHLSELDAVKMQINYFQKIGKLDESHQVANNFFEDNQTNINNYREIARIFTSMRDNEFAVQILQNGRKLAKDEFLFALELAKNYEEMGDYDNTLKYYAKHLHKNKNYQHYVFYRIRNILDKNSKQIDLVEKYFGGDNPDWMRENYAKSLAHLQMYKKAMNVYRTLPEEKLVKFAEQLSLSENPEVAQQTYYHIIESTKDDFLKYESKYKISNILFAQSKFTEAENILNELMKIKKLETGKNRFRSSLNKDVRILLANIAIQKKKPTKKVIELFESAKKFAYASHRNDITLMQINYLVLQKEFVEAKKKIALLDKNNSSSNETFKKNFYYKYLISLMTQDAAKDSLLSELVLQIPESDLTSQALNLAILTEKINDKDRFFELFRQQQLFDESAAIHLSELAKKEKNERLQILAGFWALQTNQNEKAEEYFRYNFEENDLKTLAATYLVRIDNKRELAVKLLSEMPYNVLAPELRMLIQN